MTAAPRTPRYEQTEIPRHPRYGGPFIIPPNSKRTWGDFRCETCGRMVEPRRGKPRKGACTCEYYKRTTNFIDVLQDEYLLKQWGNRQTAFGIAQRPDLILQATTCRGDSDDLQTKEDKDTLNAIVAQAMQQAGSKAKATVGTSLHKLTEKMDRGETLGYVPEAYRDDLRAYEELIKRERVEWISIETFRVHDEWKVAGTADRVGIVRRDNSIVDIKTGGLWFEPGPAMQLAMYAHSKPYDVATDARYNDPKEINTRVGYVIKLPAGQGHAELVPVDINRGWAACKIAKAVWDVRKEKFFRELPERLAEIKGMIGRASSKNELKMIWRSAKDMDDLTDEIKGLIRERAEVVER